MTGAGSGRPRGAAQGTLGPAVALALAAVLAAPGAGAAQEEPPVDSTRVRIFERLQRLARPPGADSAIYLRDSIREAEAQQRGHRPSAPSGDSIARAILELPGYGITEYQGGEAHFDARERTLILRAPESGRARVNREGIEVEADTSITYSQATGRVRTVGPSTFRPVTGDPVESGNLIYDLQSGRGSANDASTSYAQGSARWLVRGDMPYANPDSTYMSHARFTSCELEVPHYHFETDEIKIVGDRVLVARPVRLYFGDVPVMWLPFIAQGLNQDRTSGLLTPRFSVNDVVRTSEGQRRRVSNVGFYWAMSDYSDAIVALDWFSGNFLSITNSTRYKWNRQFLEGVFNARRFWRSDGSREIAFDTRHSWELGERTQLRVSGRFASSTDFVRENSLDPREVTQSIDSEGGLNRRFDWGTMALQVTRKEFLSDDRVEWTLPSINLSLSTITLFPAPRNRARFYNNLTWSGSSSFRRNTRDFSGGGPFDRSRVSTDNTTMSASSNLTLGSLTFSQSGTLREQTESDIPEGIVFPLDAGDRPFGLRPGAPDRDVTRENLDWTLSAGYQQRLIGSTTLTPSVNVSGSLFKSDTSVIARDWFAAPTRLSLNATLKTDVYGFFPAIGSFEAVRHKISPSFTYEWSPEVRPNEKQRQVFGDRTIRARNAISMTLNQTFEARRALDEAAADSAAAAEEAAGLATGEPRRLDRAEVVSLLAIQTSPVRYDFVEADSAGFWLAGFQTRTLRNQFQSDFLRGLSLSTEHDLWEDSVGANGKLADRKFAPHLSAMNFSFALSSTSSIVRWLGFGSADVPGTPEEDEEDEDDLELDETFLGGPTDESSIVPTDSRGSLGEREDRASRPRGVWNANLSYALQRPRNDALQTTQTLNGTLTLRPTEHWDLSWRTSYDIEDGSFNDHALRLTRDLHRWRANFDFLQTATGNWTFRFEVSLIDNQDLKFDYEQRDLDVGLPASRRSSGR